MSVPTRSQSGCKSSLRIQVWRSGLNGVPGGTIGARCGEPEEIAAGQLQLGDKEVMMAGRENGVWKITLS